MLPKVLVSFSYEYPDRDSWIEMPTRYASENADIGEDSQADCESLESWERGTCVYRKKQIACSDGFENAHPYFIFMTSWYFHNILF